MENTTFRYNLFLSLFLFGVVCGLTLTVLSTWADLEAANYGFIRRAKGGLTGFRCPVLMTKGETNVISIKVTNSTDGKLSPAIRTALSSPTTIFEFTDFVELQPGESATKEWAIGPENVDLKHFIFADVLVYASYPIRDREETCGIYIVGMPGKGVFYTWGLVVLSLLGMGGGLNGLNQLKDEDGSGKNTARQLVFLTIVIVLGFITVFMGWWIQGILTLVISLLFILITSGFMISSMRDS